MIISDLESPKLYEIERIRKKVSIEAATQSLIIETEGEVDDERKV